MVRGWWNTLIEMKDGSPVNREQVSSFIVDLLKDMAEGPERTLAHVVEVLVKTSLMNAAKSAVKNFGNAGLRVAQRRGEEFRLFASRAGYQVTLNEANKITAEVSSDPFASHKLKELEGGHTVSPPDPGAFVLIGKEPDGDSVRFRPDNPDESQEVVSVVTHQAVQRRHRPTPV